MATNSYIQVPPNSNGPKLYSQQHNISGDNQLIQTFHLVDKNNPTNIQEVDAQGQALVSFAEGSPTMDAFGGLRISSAEMVGSYEFTNGDMADLFFDETYLGGTIEYLPAESITKLVVPNTPGAASERSTNRYHYYQPGVGNLIIMTLALSDSGKNGNERTWGYGDHENGIFFSLRNEEFGVLLRTSSLGTNFTKQVTGDDDSYVVTVNDPSGIQVGYHVEGSGIVGYTVVTEINGNQVTIDKPLHSNISSTPWVFKEIIDFFVPQSQWNGDKLDGTGKSGMILDLTKANFYWMDFAWLGVGVVRLGVMAPDGSRWVCHTFENPNYHHGPYMATGSLPIHWHNENTGVSPTSSGSSINTICTAVYSESRTDYTFWRFADAESSLKSITSDTVFSPVLSLKPKVEYANKSNRIGIYPETLDIFVTGGPVIISIFDDATLAKSAEGTPLTSHSDWTYGEETIQYTDVATHMIGGSRFKTFYLNTGAHTIDLSKYYELNDEGYHVHYDGMSAQLMTVAGKKINSADTVSVKVCIGYRELR